MSGRTEPFSRRARKGKGKRRAVSRCPQHSHAGRVDKGKPLVISCIEDFCQLCRRDNTSCRPEKTRMEATTATHLLEHGCVEARNSRGGAQLRVTSSMTR